MINQLRTLLLNQSGPAPVFDPGEEYVPPAFVAVAPTAPLLKARAVLFGTNPDRRMLLYRTRQLLACVHAGPLAGAAFALDSRVTYLPLARGGLELPAGVTVASPSAFPLAVAGAPPAEVDGQTTYTWLVTLLGSTATIQPGSGPAASVALSFVAGLATAPIPGTSLVLSVPLAPYGTAWTVTAAADPADDLSTVAARLAATGAATPLFGAAEPYLSWGNLWASTRPLPDRLAAVACALACRTNAILTGDN